MQHDAWVKALLLVALADLLATNHKSCNMEEQADANDGQRSNGQALVAGGVPHDGEHEPDGDEPHGAENQRFVGRGGGGPKFF